MKKIYLACPYSHPDPSERERRVAIVNKKAAELMEQGNLVFSPLSHSVPISEYCKVHSTNHDFWIQQDLWILEVCNEMNILCLDGWQQSRGIEIEKTLAVKLNIPIKLIFL